MSSLREDSMELVRLWKNEEKMLEELVEVVLKTFWPMREVFRVMME
jgi:hypothetical protein